MKRIMIGASAIATVLPSLSYAQSSSDKPGANEQASEIIVTARRKEERNLDVPAAVTAIGTDRLEEQQIGETKYLQQLVPGLTQIRNASNSANVVFNIRGQGQTSGGVGDPSVIAYVNEIPAGNRNLPLYDLASVQVFKGPQGTLFGATLTGGAVMFTTARPDLSNIEGYARVKVGNYKTREIEGALNIPIVPDILGVRVAGKIERQRGFTIVDNVPGFRLDNRHSDSFRISARFQPSDFITNDTIFDYYNARTHGGANILGAIAPDVDCPSLGIGQFNNLACVFGADVLKNEFARQQARGPRHTEVTLPPNGTDIDDWLGENAKNLTIGNITSVDLNDQLKIRNIFGYSWTKSLRFAYGTDFDGSALPGFYWSVFTPPGTKSRTQMSNEFQLQGAFPNALDFVLGGYIQRDRTPSGSLDRLFVFPLFSFTIPTFPSRVNQDAVYGQATFDGHVVGIDKISLTLGGRYTWVKKNSFIGRPDEQGGEGNSSSKKFTYAATIDYKPSDDVIIYVAHRTGYKPGGSNTGLILPANAQNYFDYAPEELKDVEFGIKLAFDQGDVQGTVNFAAFKQWYKNIQRAVTIDAATTAVTNAKKATIKGIEIDASISLWERFRLSGFLALLDPKFTSYDAPRFGDGQATTPVTFADLSRTNFAGAAKTSYSVQASYDLPFMPEDLGTLRISGSFFYQSKVYTTDDNIGVPGSFNPGYHIVKARLDWQNVTDSGLDVGIFADNLTNETYRAGGTAAVLNSQGWAWHTYGPPRTYGVELRYGF